MNFDIPSAPPPGHPLSDKAKRLGIDNEFLKLELRNLQDDYKAMHAELNKSILMRDRLEGLSKELENRTKEIKAENREKMLEAEGQGQELATEVSSNLSVMRSLNASLAAVGNESQKVKEQNEALAMKVTGMKQLHDDKEKVLHEELDIAHNGHLATKTELARLRLKSAEEKEKLFAEMQQVANGLVQSRQQMKEAKETELTLRVLLKKYDEKFGGLQEALTETNGAYDNFRVEMEKMTAKTKELEKEALSWKVRWEENNKVLMEKSKEQEGIHNDLKQAHDKLLRMTSLCKALQAEIGVLEKKQQATAPTTTTTTTTPPSK